MVEHFDFQQLPGPNEVASNFDIRFRWRGITARMIVDEDYRRCVRGDGVTEHLARMHQNRIQRAFGNLFDRQQLSPRIEQHHLKILDIIRAIVLAEQIGNALGRVEER